MTRRRVRSQPYRTLLQRSDAGGGRVLSRLLGAGGIIGGAFALGLLFGDSATNDGTSALDGGLAKIDELTGEYEEVREQLRLTFHKELTEAEKAVEASRARREQVAAGVSEALPVLSATDNPLASKAPEKVAHVEPKPETKSEPKAAAPAPQPTAEPAKKAAPEPDDVAQTQAQAQAPEAAPADKDGAAAPEVVAGSRKRLASALTSLFGDDSPDWAKKANKASPQKVAQAPAPAKAAKPAAPARAKPAMGAYYLQVASSPNGEAARRLSDKLAADGHASAVIEAEVGERQMHRVVITGFADKDAASRARDKVASAHGLKGLVRQSR